MKLAHVSDLHLGKRVNEYPMLDDQREILKRIIGILDDEKPDCIIIAGDVYDKSVPSAEAVELFDDFIVELANKEQNVFIIGGNHDSQERLSFANRLIDSRGIHISSAYRGEVRVHSLRDEYGEVDIYPVPFIKPVVVRQAFSDEEIVSYSDAARAVISHAKIDTSKRNVLIAHQYVAGAVTSESEDISIGGLDKIDADVFGDFDYVALGHLHKPQNINPHVRYSGSPLKYSVSEKDDVKSVTIVELKEKENMTVREVPLLPAHDLVEITGKYDELMSKSYYGGTSLQEDYIHVVLTDEDPIPYAAANLLTVYHRLLGVKYNNTRTNTDSEADVSKITGKESPLDLFCSLYMQQNGKQPSDEQRAYLTERITNIWEEDA